MLIGDVIGWRLRSHRAVAELVTLGLAQLDAVSYVHQGLLGLKEALMNQTGDTYRAPCQPGFTEKQGQYLAFIYAYTRINRRPPAEADMQRYFQVTPPSVHQMVITLERKGLVRRQPGQPRSIQVLVAPENLPILR